MNDKENNTNKATIEVIQNSDENIEQAIARTILKPSLNASRIIQEVHKNTDNVTTSELMHKLKKQMEHVSKGDLETAEAMLIAQSHTLDALFTEFSIKALRNKGHYDWFKSYINAALKTQNQCRMTLGTLGELKNPKPYIQNNKAQYQQINNGEQAPHAQEKTKTTNELLTDGSNDYETMDTRGAPEASGIDKEMEAVGAKHRG